MFGSKLKTWMENHIGRPKRKTQQEKEKPLNGSGARARGVILESSESLAHSDTGISSGSQQVLSSSTTDNRESYCTTTMESEKSSGMSHCPTAVSLPSPESAYSTGYSTDGASPGGTGPPEYYINIRTGKHYFPSPAPTPTSPQPNTAFSQLHPGPPKAPVGDVALLPNRPDGVCLSTFVPEPSTKSPRPNPSSHFEIFSFSKSPCKKSPPKSQLSSFKLFLKSPKQDKGKLKGVDANKTPVFENKKKILSPGKNVKWYKQPFQKFGQRRVDDESSLKNEMKKEAYLDRNLGYLLAKDSAASPRQRNRIKTNPWLPTEPMSSQNFHSLNFSPSLARNRSCTNTPLQNRKEMDAIQQRIKQMSAKYEESKEYLNGLEKVVGRHVGQKLYLELSDHSEEDLTLNEMMGTYNESYVYEKETDILSDSDPTDCEDYVSDSEADNGGDEQDSHDDELDFIDNGSVSEGDDNLLRNTGKCTYHDVYVKKNSFLYKTDRHHSRKGSDGRKSFRRDGDSKTRRSKEEKKRKPTRKSFKEEEGGKKKSEGKPQQKAELNENVGGLNLSRVLLQRMMEKNVSKSAEGTPVSIRRQKLMKELRETHIGSEKPETTGKSLLLVDAEADRKYKELIEEAENIFETMQNSPVIQNRKKILERKPNSADPWRKTEATFRVHPDNSAKKSPKNLGLKLSETPKKLKTFNFSEKTSFKAHSPLDPLGPTFRNFTVFKPVNGDSGKISSSSSEDSEPGKTFRPWEESGGVIGSPIVPIAFQSVDLGKPLTSYCPQSEPVKRKIYSCSKTYDKLVKQFENKATIFEEKAGRVRHGSLMTKRRFEAPRRGNQVQKAQKRDSGEGVERYGRGYSPRFSPRRASMPTASPRLSFDLEVFRSPPPSRKLLKD